MYVTQPSTRGRSRSRERPARRSPTPDISVLSDGELSAPPSEGWPPPSPAWRPPEASEDAAPRRHRAPAAAAWPAPARSWDAPPGYAPPGYAPQAYPPRAAPAWHEPPRRRSQEPYYEDARLPPRRPAPASAPTPRPTPVAAPPNQNAPRILGYVTHYRVDKGFGFALTERGDLVFFHRSGLAPRALEALDARRPGALNVDMHVEMADRGLRASFVGVSKYDCFDAKPVKYAA